MILLFVVGYTFIALEHKVKVDKSAIALLMCGAIWTVFSLWGHDSNISHEMVDHLGDTCEILVFLIGAMTIVDLIDTHGGFNVITDHITTRNKHKLMWLLAIITFFHVGGAGQHDHDDHHGNAAAANHCGSEGALDFRQPDRHRGQQRRCVVAHRRRDDDHALDARQRHCGGPDGNALRAVHRIGNHPDGDRDALRGQRRRGPVDESAFEAELPKGVGPRLSKFILVTGVLSLLFVPVFKSITHLPPYMGMMVSLGVMWVLTEIIYDRKRGIEESIKCRVSKVLKHIDMPTILFFLGILMSVAALQSAGVLTDVANWLDKQVHEVFTIAGVIGVLSSVIDNVPLVAACMGMYPVMDAAAVAASADPAYMQSFVQDGLFWHLLTYCAGVGGSLLIIGSAAGVVAMGLEKINFAWYFKKITLLAFVGYLSGILVILLEHLLIGL